MFVVSGGRGLLSGFGCTKGGGDGGGIDQFSVVLL